MKVYRVREYASTVKFEQGCNELAKDGFRIESWRDGLDQDEIYSLVAVFVKNVRRES
jgi:hypothetical protein